MRVVQVAALRDYEGTAWTALYSNLENAYEALREAEYDDVVWVDDVDVAWVGVDEAYYDRVDSLVPVRGEDETFTWTRDGVQVEL